MFYLSSVLRHCYALSIFVTQGFTRGYPGVHKGSQGVTQGFTRGLGVMVMVFDATFNNISVIYIGYQFCWWRKPEYPEITID
jgi:hypothetical protein